MDSTAHPAMLRSGKPGTHFIHDKDDCHQSSFADGLRHFMKSQVAALTSLALQQRDAVPPTHFK